MRPISVFLEQNENMFTGDKKKLNYTHLGIFGRPRLRRLNERFYAACLQLPFCIFDSGILIVELKIPAASDAPYTTYTPSATLFPTVPCQLMAKFESLEVLEFNKSFRSLFCFLTFFLFSARVQSRIRYQ